MGTQAVIISSTIRTPWGIGVFSLRRGMWKSTPNPPSSRRLDKFRLNPRPSPSTFWGRLYPRRTLHVLGRSWRNLQTGSFSAEQLLPVYLLPSLGMWKVFKEISTSMLSVSTKSWFRIAAWPRSTWWRKGNLIDWNRNSNWPSKDRMVLQAPLSQFLAEPPV